MSRYPKLKHYLNERRKQLSQGYNLIPWDQLAAQCNVPTQTLLNWKNGLTVPSRPKDEQALATVFGVGVWAALGKLPPNVDPNFIYLIIGAQKDKNIARILEDAMKQAEKYQPAEVQGQLQLV